MEREALEASADIVLVVTLRSEVKGPAESSLVRPSAGSRTQHPVTCKRRSDRPRTVDSETPVLRAHPSIQASQNG
jgi:hypothetical protein